MDKQRKTGGAGVLIALVLCVLVVGLYLGPYLVLADASIIQETSRPIVLRHYPNAVIAWIYCPAAWVEAKIKAEPVYVYDNVNSSVALYRIDP